MSYPAEFTIELRTQCSDSEEGEDSHQTNVELYVGKDIIAAAELFKSLVSMNQPVIVDGGYIRLKMMDETGCTRVLAIRSKTVNW